jgi:hypothetical protein
MRRGVTFSRREKVAAKPPDEGFAPFRSGRAFLPDPADRSFPWEWVERGF